LNDFRRGGGTILMTTHDIHVGLECCDRVVVLDKGRLIFDAETSSIDADRFSRDYLSYARSGT
jgi:ABC-type multidrug transport system ATPase subunit